MCAFVCVCVTVNQNPHSGLTRCPAIIIMLLSVLNATQNLDTYLDVK